MFNIVCACLYGSSCRHVKHEKQAIVVGCATRSTVSGVRRSDQESIADTAGTRPGHDYRACRTVRHVVPRSFAAHSRAGGAKLVHRTVEGGVHRCSLRAEPLTEAQRWLADYQEFWKATLESLAIHVRDLERKRAH